MSQRRLIEKLAESYRICTRCIMDTSDPDIYFDEKGICNRCKAYEALLASRFPPGADKKQLMAQLVARIKHEGRNSEYDCHHWCQRRRR